MTTGGSASEPEIHEEVKSKVIQSLRDMHVIHRHLLIEALRDCQNDPIPSEHLRTVVRRIADVIALDARDRVEFMSSALHGLERRGR